jgi:hypothetical protein
VRSFHNFPGCHSFKKLMARTRSERPGLSSFQNALGPLAVARLHFPRRGISPRRFVSVARLSACDLPTPGSFPFCPIQLEFNLIAMHGQSSRIPNHGHPAQRPSLWPGASWCAPVLTRLVCTLVGMISLLSIIGCGKTLRNSATEQLILSDSVDRAIRSIDFTPLAGYACYLDTSHLKTVKSATFVNADYVTSSLRNHLASAGGILTDERDDAEIVVEPRLGALGANESEVTYGIPSSSILTQAASIVPTAPPVPTIPEISLARKNDQMAATKLAVFAYNAKTGNPVWQSGIATAKSYARDTWLFGVGPFQSGTIYEKTRFIGIRTKLPLIGGRGEDQRRQLVSHDQEYVFRPPPVSDPSPEYPVRTASAESVEDSDSVEKQELAE